MIQDVKATGTQHLTLPEAAFALRMSVYTLRSPVWLARLGAVKVAGRWLVSAEAITEVLGGTR